eukprot:4608679-Amphidinium_carterae.1
MCIRDSSLFRAHVGDLVFQDTMRVVSQVWSFAAAALGAGASSKSAERTSTLRNVLSSYSLRGAPLGNCGISRRASGSLPRSAGSGKKMNG